MTPKELKVYKETRLRNLERKYSKLKEHPEFAEECIDLKCEIDSLKKQLS